MREALARHPNIPVATSLVQYRRRVSRNARSACARRSRCSRARCPRSTRGVHVPGLALPARRDERDDHAHQPGAHATSSTWIPPRPSSRRTSTWRSRPGDWARIAMRFERPRDARAARWVTVGSSCCPTSRSSRCSRCVPVLINVLYSVTGSDNLYPGERHFVGLANYAHAARVRQLPRSLDAARATSSGAPWATPSCSCRRRSS